MKRPLPGSLFSESDDWLSCCLYYTINNRYIIEVLYLIDDDHCIIDWSYTDQHLEIILL